MFDLKILYAEDNQQSRKSYLLGLKQYFKEVIEAQDGEEALALYDKHQPDILLTDINMPGLDGLELIRIIREKDRTIKIIVLSAFSDQEKLLKAIPLGLSSYLIKPVKRDDFKKSLLDTASTVVKSSTVNLPNGNRFQIVGHTLMSNGEEHLLSKKEYLVIKALIEKMPNPLSYQELAHQVWDSDEASAYDKIQNVIKRIRKKSPTLINSIYGYGYKINTSEEP